jgi:translation initiation factor IF-2
MSAAGGVVLSEEHGMKRRGYPGRWACVLLLVAAAAPGCADHEETIKRLQQENASLSHDLGRVGRDRSDCMRELEKARAELAAARTAGAETEPRLAAAREQIAQLEEAARRAAEQEQASRRIQDQLAQRLMDAEKRLAERVQQAARAEQAVRALEAEVAALTAELAAARAELDAAPAAPRPDQQEPPHTDPDDG